MDSNGSVSTMQLYGGLIGVVSGSYSVYLAVTGSAMTTAAWGMLALGSVVTLHGLVLFTPAAARIGSASGPLMIGYSLLMGGNQALMSAGTGMTMGMDDSTGMDDMDGMGTMSSMDGATADAAMGTDAGMVAIALLMLGSGLIMTLRDDMM